MLRRFGSCSSDPAADGPNNDLGRFYDPHHLSVIRLLKMMMENAHKNGVWVGICGELSVSPPRTVLPLRNAIHSIDIRETSPAILTAIKSDETPKH